ncbi:MAG: GNAT family N-acetyltransferase [Planctomycetes bacterium]|nr:GNAT family N-acetyltransferase [Planctomycetota bacterium]
MINKQEAELIYQTYQERHARLFGSGYEQVQTELLTTERAVVLREQGRAVLFFQKGSARGGNKCVLSTMLLLAPDKVELAQKLLLEYLGQESAKSVLFIVEDYLSEEMRLAQALGGQVDHTAIRLTNYSLSSTLEQEINNSDVVIETFQPGQDEERFMQIFNQTFAALCAPTNLQEVREWTKAPSFSPGHYLFAVRNGETVGFIALEGDLKKDFIYLQEIGVLEQEQGRGVAGVIIRESYSRLRQEGFSRIGTGVLGSNTRAYNFFVKWGFEPVYTRTFLRRN